MAQVTATKTAADVAGFTNTYHKNKFDLSAALFSNRCMILGCEKSVLSADV